MKFVKGHPRNPNSLDDCLAKMRACMEYSQEDKILRNFQKIADLLLELEKARDVRPLIGFLSPQTKRKRK